MDNRDQSQSYDPTELPDRGSRAKLKKRALALKQSRFSSELERLRAISKRTFSSGNRMAVQTFLRAIFNQVSRWQAEDRLEEELYRLLDSLTCAAENRGSVCCGDLLHSTARGPEEPKQVGDGVAICGNQ
jgi:hypothetical protein